MTTSTKAKTATKPKPTKPAIAVVRGVRLDKVNEKTLTGHLTSIGVRPQKAATLALKLELYLDWTADMLKKRDEAAEASGGVAEDYGICDNCEAPCDPDGKTCPVCGKDHEEASAPTAEAAPTEQKLVKVPKAKKEAAATKAAPPVVATQGDLDETVDRIKQLVESSMHNHHQLGRELLQCFNSKLYKTRLGDSGKPVYKSWDQFCDAELPMGGRQARDIMAVAERYTEKQVVEVGIDKLRLIAKLPPEAQSELLAKAKTMSSRQVAEVTRGGHRRAPAGARDTALRQGSEAAKAKRARQLQAESGEAVTVAFQLGEYELPLRPVANGFVAQQEQVNGVVSTYTIVTVGKRRYMRIKHARPAKK